MKDETFRSLPASLFPSLRSVALRPVLSGGLPFRSIRSLLFSVDGDARQVDGAGAGSPERVVAPDARSPQGMAGGERVRPPDRMGTPEGVQIADARTPDGAGTPERVVHVDE